MSFCVLLFFTGDKTLLSQSRSSKKGTAVFCPFEADKYDMCLKGCQMYYPGNISLKRSNPKCQEDCYDQEGNPKAQVEQISLVKRLAYLLDSRQFREDISYTDTRRTAFFSNKGDAEDLFLEDFFDGTAEKKCNSRKGKPISSDFSIQLATYTDGFNLFKRGGVSMTVVAFVIMNLPPPELRLVSRCFTCNTN